MPSAGRKERLFQQPGKNGNFQGKNHVKKGKFKIGYENKTIY
jgi:hypothetical protein